MKRRHQEPLRSTQHRIIHSWPVFIQAWLRLDQPGKHKAQAPRAATIHTTQNHLPITGIAGIQSARPKGRFWEWDFPYRELPVFNRAWLRLDQPGNHEAPAPRAATIHTIQNHSLMAGIHPGMAPNRIRIQNSICIDRY